MIRRDFFSNFVIGLLGVFGIHIKGHSISEKPNKIYLDETIKTSKFKQSNEEGYKQYGILQVVISENPVNIPPPAADLGYRFLKQEIHCYQVKAFENTILFRTEFNFIYREDNEAESSFRDLYKMIYEDENQEDNTFFGPRETWIITRDCQGNTIKALELPTQGFTTICSMQLRHFFAPNKEYVHYYKVLKPYDKQFPSKIDPKDTSVFLRKHKKEGKPYITPESKRVHFGSVNNPKLI